MTHRGPFQPLPFHVFYSVTHFFPSGLCHVSKTGSNVKVLSCNDSSGALWDNKSGEVYVEIANGPESGKIPSLKYKETCSMYILDLKNF